jgi:TnpA family transposase
VTASLLVAKLQVQSRQSTATKALVEHGRAVRTLFLLRYLPDPAYRREISRQLNKGESFHALRRRIFIGQSGQIHRVLNATLVGDAEGVGPAMRVTKI